MTEQEFCNWLHMLGFERGLFPEYDWNGEYARRDKLRKNCKWDITVDVGHKDFSACVWWIGTAGLNINAFHQHYETGELDKALAHIKDLLSDK